MKYEINQNQCGFLMKHGRFIKMLFCGTYHYMKSLGYQVEMEPSWLSKIIPYQTADVTVD